MSQEDPETLDLNVGAASSEQRSSPLLCVGVSLTRRSADCHAYANFLQDINIQEEEIVFMIILLHIGTS